MGSARPGAPPSQALTRPQVPRSEVQLLNIPQTPEIGCNTHSTAKQTNPSRPLIAESPFPAYASRNGLATS
nr:unnamed protein product [Spirometra erinaceieuropaei]